MENSTLSKHLGKTLNKVMGAQYAYEKAVILRKSLPGLDSETRQIFGELLNELESYSIDMQDEYWNDFNNAIRTKLEEDGVTCSPRQPFKQTRKCELHEFIWKVHLSLCDQRRKPTWSSPQKVVHLLVWEINPIRNMKGGLKWLRKDTNPKKS